MPGICCFWPRGGRKLKSQQGMGGGQYTGVLGVGFFDPNFSGKDFCCAEDVDCTANNAMMLLFTIL